MDWYNFILGILLILLSILWLIHELDESNKLKKKNYKVLLALQPRYYLGVFILFAMGVTSIIKAF